MYYESLLSPFDFDIIQIHVFFKTISLNTVCYDFGVRTPNPTQRRTHSKTFITSVFSVVLSGAQIPSTEYESEYEYKKSFITLGPELLGDHPISIATLCCFDKVSSIETMICRDTEDHIRVAWEKL